MDKFEYKVKFDEIKSLISQGAYEEAADVADTVDWSSVKDVRTLCMISDLYKKNRLFENAIEVLRLAYSRQQTRPIIKSLCELSIELGDLISAMEYKKRFEQLSPKDPTKYVLQYKLYKAQGISLEEQIGVLEELKSNEYMERWAYELAELYHRVGMAEKCVEACDEIVLWSVDGKYVIKALELKAQHKPLTDQETYKYELLRKAGGELNIQYSLKEEQAKAQEAKKDLEVKNIDVSPYNTQNLQAVVAEGLQDIIDGKTKNMGDRKIPESYEEAVAMDKKAKEAAKGAVETSGVVEEGEDLLVTKIITPIMNEEPVGQELIEEGTEDIPVSGGNLSDTKLLGDIAKEVAEEMLGAKKSILKSDTDEIKKISEVDLKENDPKNAFTPFVEQGNPSLNPEEKSVVNDTGVIEKFHKGSNLDEMLTQGYDGQISLVVPDQHPAEKQITGQISINDVMQEWERKKKENEEKRVAEVKERIRKETDNLLADFDESTKSGLLEQIEDAMVNAAIKEEHDRLVAERPREIKVSDIDSLPVKKTSDTEEIIKEAIDEELNRKKEEVPDDGIEEIAEIEEDIEEEVQLPDTEEAAEEEAEDTAEDEEDIEDDGLPEDDVEDVPEDEIAEDTDEERAEEPVTEDHEEEAKEEPKEKVREEKPIRRETRTKTVRELSEAEREEFAAFIHHRSTRKQLVEALDNFSLAAYTGNIMVTGEEDSEVTAFSKILIHEIQLSDSNFTGKVAKVSGEKLNRKDIVETIKTVSNGALIISEAEGLKAKTINNLIEALQSSEMGIVVILQSYSDAMDKLSEGIKGLKEVFNLRVDLKAFDDKTLVEYAKTYAYDNEYTIDDLGVLALHTRIADMQTADHEVSLSEIEELVDEAIYYACKKNPAHFFDVLFGKRYDEEDMIVLRERDFMHY